MATPTSRAPPGTLHMQAAAASPGQQITAATSHVSPSRPTPAAARAAASAHAKISLRANINREPAKVLAQQQQQPNQEPSVLQPAPVQAQIGVAKTGSTKRDGAKAGSHAATAAAGKHTGKEQTRTGARKAGEAQGAAPKPAASKPAQHSHTSTLQSTQGRVSGTLKSARSKPAGPQLEVTGRNVAPPDMSGTITLRGSALLGSSSRGTGHGGVHHHTSASVQPAGTVIGTVPAASPGAGAPYALHTVHAHAVHQQTPQAALLHSPAAQAGGPVQASAASPSNRGASLARLKELRGVSGRKQPHSPAAPGHGHGPVTGAVQGSRSVASEASELISLLENAEGLGAGVPSPRAADRAAHTHLQGMLMHLPTYFLGSCPGWHHHTAALLLLLRRVGSGMGCKSACVQHAMRSKCQTCA